MNGFYLNNNGIQIQFKFLHMGFAKFDRLTKTSHEKRKLSYCDINIICS